MKSGCEAEMRAQKDQEVKEDSWPLVAARTFIQSVRESGYASPASAVAELLDNAIDAGATRVDIRTTSRDGALELSIQDNGHGMTPSELRRAVQFGGSSRFDCRTSIGRFGMGLPNACLSQARCFSVTSWQSARSANSVTVDADDIIDGKTASVPKVQRIRPPADSARSGTVVRLQRCDRLGYKRRSYLQRHLRIELGRMFRHHMWRNLNMTLDGEALDPVDPLFLSQLVPLPGQAQLFCEPTSYRVRTIDGRSGTITVTFSILPVSAWSTLDARTKRKLGITRAATVSVVRAGREIDRGWLLMGSKRKQNYDDWWRCEITFSPALDEMFGVSNTKQGIRPTRELTSLLQDDNEATANTLNAVVRKEHALCKADERFREAEQTAGRYNARLPRVAVLDKRLDDPRFQGGQCPLKLSQRSLGTEDVYELRCQSGQLQVTLNQDHPFFTALYTPLAESKDPRNRLLRLQLELLILALARAEAALGASILNEHRHQWSLALSLFLTD